MIFDIMALLIAKETANNDDDITGRKAMQAVEIRRILKNTVKYWKYKKKYWKVVKIMMMILLVGKLCSRVELEEYWKILWNIENTKKTLKSGEK